MSIIPPGEDDGRANFADKYRPDTFAKVFGQESVVDCLSGLIKRGRIGRNILLHGSVGSGKTTLAWIYACALNCEMPDPDGSPCCDRCDPCRRAGEGHIVGFHDYNVSRYGGGKDEVRRWAEAKNRDERECNYRILFFDEAQSLTLQACDVLLDHVERPADRVLFFFATTEVDKIRPALRSRLFDLLIRPLPRLEAIDFLRRSVKALSLDCEPGALELLAGLRPGYPRDLLLGLDRVHERGSTQLTIKQVRAAFDLDQTEVLLDYFEALADGDLVRQTKLVFGWRERAADKIRWIQAFLVSLYHNNILHHELVVDGVIEAIPESARLPLLDRFCRRLGLARPDDLEQFWHRLMDFWPMPEATVDETILSLRLTLFHRLVNAGLTDEIGQMGDRKNHLARSVEGASILIAATSQGFGPPPIPRPGSRAESETSGFLTTTDVRKIVNCASFLTQEHGVLFNAAFEITPAMLGVEAQAPAIALIEAFREDLAAQARAWGDEPFASLTLLERDATGVVGRIVAHLTPPNVLDPVQVDSLGRAQAWARDWLRGVAPAGDDDTVQVEVAGADRPAALAFHWDTSLKLCAGLDEEATAWDRATGKHKSLLKLLGVRPRRPGPGPILGYPLVAISSLLSDAAIAEACRLRLDLLSAFDDGAWSWVRTGWERDEFRVREKIRGEREAELARLRQKFGGDTSAARAAIAAVVQCWSTDPRERRRRQRGWWE